MSLTATAKRHGISRASVVRFVREARQRESAFTQFQPEAQQPVAFAA
jgi:hypothetical protein